MHALLCLCQFIQRKWYICSSNGDQLVTFDALKRNTASFHPHYYKSSAITLFFFFTNLLSFFRVLLLVLPVFGRLLLLLLRLWLCNRNALNDGWDNTYSIQYKLKTSISSSISIKATTRVTAWIYGHFLLRTTSPIWFCLALESAYMDTKIREKEVRMN